MGGDALLEAQQALGRAEWEAARRGFEAALDRSESPEALEGLGMAAWWLEEVATVLATPCRSRARATPRSPPTSESASSPIERHVSNIPIKLDLPIRAAAAAHAVRHELA